MDPLVNRTTRENRAINARSPAKLILFCLPHAGGSATYYAKFGTHFSPDIAVHPLELPGRGRRSREPLLTEIEALSRDLLAQILSKAGDGPYALFGHSMGALLAYRCAQMALEKQAPLPVALFVSSAAIPGQKGESRLPLPSPFTPETVWNHVVGMGGVPQCIVDSADFRRYIEPILFADFTAVKSWSPSSVAPLPVPITAFLGSDDIVTETQVRKWAEFTTCGCDVRAFGGNHFYLQNHWSDLAARILQTLDQQVLMQGS